MKASDQLRFVELLDEGHEFKLIDILGSLYDYGNNKLTYTCLMHDGYKYKNCKIDAAMYYGTFIGARYFHGQKKNNVAEVFSSKTIEVNTNNTIYTTLKDVVETYGLDKKYYDHGFGTAENGKFYNNEILSQRVAVTEHGSCKYIIPCFLIASTFYFTSTRMMNMVLKGKVDEAIFDKVGFNENGVPVVYYNHSYATTDIPFIVLYNTSEYAKKMWMRVRYFKKVPNNKYSYIDARFPYDVPKSFDCYVQQIEATSKNLFRVVAIPNSNMFFNYDLYIKVAKDFSGEKNDVRVIEKDDPEVSDIVTHDNPSSSFTKTLTRVELQKQELENSNITIITEYLKMENNELTMVNQFKGSEANVNLSFGKPVASGKTSKGNIIRKGNIAERKEYVIKGNAFDFIDEISNLLERLYGYSRIKAYDGRVPMRSKKSNRSSLTKRESYDGTTGSMRAYRRIDYAINNRHLVMIDIDFAELKTRTSMYFLVGNIIADSDVISLLQSYVDTIAYDEIEKYFLQKGIRFVYKKHVDNVEGMVKAMVIDFERRHL